MEDQPKKHHYVPSFHLARFTMTGTQDGGLFVMDKRLRHRWTSSPKKSARANNFYKVELGELDPMGIEKALAKIEGLCGTVVRNVITQEEMPTGDDFDILLNFVALAFVRVPSIRSTHSHFIDRVAKKLGRLAFLGQDGAKRLRELSESEGQPLSDEELQQFQDFVESDDYTADLEQNWHVRTMIDSANVLLPALALRHWAIWTVADESPDLVCSDRPVVLWASPPLSGMLSPNFATPNTLLTIPLSRRALLASRLEEMPSDRYIMDSVDVALMNTFRAMYSNQIYSSQENWIWTMDGEILESQAFLDDLPPIKA